MNNLRWYAIQLTAVARPITPSLSLGDPSDSPGFMSALLRFSRAPPPNTRQASSQSYANLDIEVSHSSCSQRTFFFFKWMVSSFVMMLWSATVFERSWCSTNLKSIGHGGTGWKNLELYTNWVGQKRNGHVFCGVENEMCCGKNRQM